MARSTFHLSRVANRARRTDRPVLELIHGADGRSAASQPDAPRPSAALPAHPAREGFTPDGIPSHARGSARISEPVSPTGATLWTSSASVDADGTAATGSGPMFGPVRILERIMGPFDADAG